LFFVYFIGVVGGIIAGRFAAWLLDILVPRHPQDGKVKQYENAARQYESLKKTV